MAAAERGISMRCHFVWVEIEGSGFLCSSCFINTIEVKCLLMGLYIKIYLCTPKNHILEKWEKLKLSLRILIVFPKKVSLV